MSNKAMYTLKDYEEAKAALAAVNQRFADYTGNNPDKYRTAQRDARERLRVIEKYLKDVGILPSSDQEMLERDLDRAFPNARSKQVVTFKDTRYQRRFEPAEWSNSRKNVMQWRKWWEKVE